MRLIKSKDPELLCRIFKVYVRPIVETCSSTFVITSKKEVEQLESVQRRFTKAAFGRSFPGEDIPDYRERCQRLELDTLEERRIRSDLILAKKILLGKCATKTSSTSSSHALAAEQPNSPYHTAARKCENPPFSFASPRLSRNLTPTSCSAPLSACTKTLSKTLISLLFVICVSSPHVFTRLANVQNSCFTALCSKQMNE